jgi:AmpD protein
MKNRLTFNHETGLLDPICYRPSPHHDERPAQTPIDMIVIHGISLPPGEFGTPIVEQFFCGCLPAHLPHTVAAVAALKVSSHLFIKRTGEIIQFVPFTKRAWHAGESYFAGKTHCNDFSIGIELEGTDHISYEPIQYQQLIQVVCLLRKIYPAISPDRIVGHVDIAPGRKTDPGPAFDWAYLRGNLK